MKNILVLFIGLFISLNICIAQFDEVFVAANQTYLTGSKGSYQIRRPDSKVGFQIGAVIDFKSEKYNVLGPRNIEVSYLYTQGEIYGGFTAGGGHMISDFSYSRQYSLAFFYNVSRSFFNEFDIAVSTIFMQHTFGIRYRIVNDLKSNTAP